ncbi:MAG: NAD-dependent epimerase/dehydratase family protein [Geothrix sp.]|uniref:NAD-dependent epimerase/dehydratase family protein n=1 Tax=Geothrix sp. TaxID=1962974 RepID=UPI0017FDF9EE|nr:NAD-dependent epimerase/dehydratase family protein [Geothrix sp.]NWJ42011.1 NAD-dependent epimerase/dehydratase family protein [Geothrix sp.]WIL20020.1 MAG: NAD-dependent epimerase/dehydratase family protein [Geothrix sp.]
MENRAEGKGTCLIAGCGYTGTRLARRRLGAGPVLALVRRAVSAEVLIRQGIPAVAADVDAGIPLLALPRELASVIYLAPPAGAGTEDLRLARFLQALGPARPQVVVYFSTTGVYGDTRGAAVDEASPVAPREDRSRQRWEAEGQVAAWCGARGVRPVILRVPAIYGPHRLPLDRLRRSEPVLRDGDSGPGNRIHVDDLVAACLAALDRPVSGAFNLTDGAPESMAAFTIRVAKLAGLPAPRRVSWAEAQSVMSPGVLAFLRESRLVTSRRMQELGWTPEYGNPDDGIRASLVEMGWGNSSSAGR